jgi:hypothetical protein
MVKGVSVLAAIAKLYRTKKTLISGRFHDKPLNVFGQENLTSLAKIRTCWIY